MIDRNDLDRIDVVDYLYYFLILIFNKKRKITYFNSIISVKNMTILRNNNISIYRPNLEI